VNQSALTIGFVSLEPPLIDAAVHETLNTKALSHTVVALGAWGSSQGGPLTFIIGAVINNSGLFIHS
jgi:hypothetical protein